MSPNKAEKQQRGKKSEKKETKAEPEGEKGESNRSQVLTLDGKAARTTTGQGAARLRLGLVRSQKGGHLFRDVAFTVVL